MSAPRSYAVDLLRLAGPVALARLGIIAMAFVDAVVVGQLAPKQLPHQALGWAPTAVFLVASIGLLQGVQVLAARSIGEKNPAGAGEALKRGLVLALIAGGVSAAALWFGGERIFTYFGVPAELAAPSAAVMRIFAISVPLHLIYIAATFFLEAIKKPAVSTAVMWAANAVNLGLNLLWVPEHGAIGSAWATVGGRVFLAGISLVCILFLRDRKHYGVTFASHAGPSYGALLRVGAAAAVSQAVEAGAFSAMTVIAGRISADVVAAYQILLNVLALAFMVALGLSAATAVLVAEADGRKAPRDVTHAGWTGLQLNSIAMLLCAIGLIAFPHAIARAYSADLVLAGIVAAHLWIAAFVLIPDGAQAVAASALRARGDNWFPTFSHIIAYAAVMPGLGFWLAEHLHMGVAGLIWAIALASLLSGGVLVARWAFLSVRPGRVESADSPSP